jgi:hypothetical protein
LSLDGGSIETEVADGSREGCGSSRSDDDERPEDVRAPGMVSSGLVEDREREGGKIKSSITIVEVVRARGEDTTARTEPAAVTRGEVNCAADADAAGGSLGLVGREEGTMESVRAKVDCDGVAAFDNRRSGELDCEEVDSTRATPRGTEDDRVRWMGDDMTTDANESIHTTTIQMSASTSDERMRARVAQQIGCSGVAAHLLPSSPPRSMSEVRST